MQQKHVEHMQLKLREGRARKAAPLHSTQHADPQGDFSEGGVGDRWEQRGEDGQWVRLHRSPRTALVTPFRVPRVPGRKSRLASIRHTAGVDETGMKFDIMDDWTQPGVAHRVLPQRWTRITIFRTSAFDDQGFGGDQRRQQDRAQSRISPALT